MRCEFPAVANTPFTLIENMNRAEHMQWAKDRALEYVQQGQLTEAIASMISDLNKHPETQEHMGIGLMMQLAMSGMLRSQEEVRRFIEGFN
jgi:hypothetical protein